MDTLKNLFNMVDSHNAEYAAVLRLKNAHEYIVSPKNNLAIALIYYLLDPMICIGIEDIAGVQSFIERAALKKELEETQLQHLRQFKEALRRGETVQAHPCGHSMPGKATTEETF
jgi:hypothetical protein